MLIAELFDADIVAPLALIIFGLPMAYVVGNKFRDTPRVSTLRRKIIARRRVEGRPPNATEDENADRFPEGRSEPESNNHEADGKAVSRTFVIGEDATEDRTKTSAGQARALTSRFADPGLVDRLSEQLGAGDDDDPAPRRGHSERNDDRHQEPASGRLSDQF